MTNASPEPAGTTSQLAAGGVPHLLGVPGTSGRWSGPRRGTVVAFDERRGWGAIADGSGWQVGFHCTALADGTRSIAVGSEVVFVIRPGHHGRFEAEGIHLVSR